MSIITITTPTIGGVLNKIGAGEAAEKIFVRKGETVPASMAGWIGTGRVKGADGQWADGTEFGRLAVSAAVIEDGDKTRCVLQVQGGLRGVLFPSAKEDGPEYLGRLDAGDGKVFPLFGRKRTSSKDGTSFISISSMEREAPRQTGHASTAQPQTDQGWDDDVPF